MKLVADGQVVGQFVVDCADFGRIYHRSNLVNRQRTPAYHTRMFPLLCCSQDASRRIFTVLVFFFKR